MAFLIGFLTLIMVLDCLVLVLLVLIQLPKKEAGAGLDFGGAASDAMFGAGSGTVVTKLTKYAAGTFFVLAVVLSILQSRFHYRTTSGFQQRLQQSSQPTALPPATPPPTTPPTNTLTLSNTVSPVEATNTPAPSASSPASTNTAPQ